MPRPLVSVIITVYNRENYIEDAIKSVLNSSFRDYELIIVDDASSDNTLNVVSHYKSHEKIKIYKNLKNLGQFENRNIAATYAQGKYIKYLDSDDLIYKFGLDTMVESIEQYPQAGAAISHDTLHENKPYPIFMSSHEAYYAFFFNKGFPTSGPSSAIINKNTFNAVGGFPKPHYVGSDLLLYLKLAEISGIVKLPPALIWYRRHLGQEIQLGINTNEYLKNDFTMISKYLFDENCPLSEEEINRASKLQKHRLLRNLVKLSFKNRSPFESLRIAKHANIKFSDFRYIF